MSGVLHRVAEGRREAVALVAAVLVAGVVAGLIVGGSFAGSRGAAHAASPAPSAAVSVPATTAAPLAEGAVVADAGADDLTTEIALGRTHTLDGAVSAFTAYASWLIGSPAAAADPWHAPEAVGGSRLSHADAGSLVTMKRSPGDHLDAEHGAYRVLAHAGDEATPEQVMLEVTAPLTMSGKTQWRTIGGVVAWTAQGWQLATIEPRDVVQPPAGRNDVRALSADERSRTLVGLGWRAFRSNLGR